MQHIKVSRSEAVMLRVSPDTRKKVLTMAKKLRRCDNRRVTVNDALNVIITAAGL